MPKLPRLTAADAGVTLLKASFVWLRSKGSHRMRTKSGSRLAVPFHGNAALHTKTVKGILETIEDTFIQSFSLNSLLRSEMSGHKGAAQ